MKKFCLFFVICLCCLLCSCDKKEETAIYDSSNYTKAKEFEPSPWLTIRTEKERYSVNDTKISYVLSVSPDIYPEHVNCDGPCEIHLVSTGGQFEDLQVLKEDGWYSLPWRPPLTEDLPMKPANNELYYPGTTPTCTVNLATYYSFPLPPGEYRILRSPRVWSNTFIVE